MSQSALTPHRGVTILVLGVVSLMFAITAPFAWIMGRADLREMDAGAMDPEGRGLTQAGMIIGMIVSILFLLSIAMFIVLAMLGVGIAAVSGG